MSQLNRGTGSERRPKTGCGNGHKPASPASRFLLSVPEPVPEILSFAAFDLEMS